MRFCKTCMDRMMSMPEPLPYVATGHGGNEYYDDLTDMDLGCLLDPCFVTTFRKKYEFYSSRHTLKDFHDVTLYDPNAGMKPLTYYGAILQCDINVDTSGHWGSLTCDSIIPFDSFVIGTIDDDSKTVTFTDKRMNIKGKWGTPGWKYIKKKRTMPCANFHVFIVDPTTDKIVRHIISDPFVVRMVRGRTSTKSN